MLSSHQHLVKEIKTNPKVHSFSGWSSFHFSKPYPGEFKIKLCGNYLINLMDVYRQTGIIMARKFNLGPQLPRWTVYNDQINWITAKTPLSILLYIHTLWNTPLCLVINRTPTLILPWCTKYKCKNLNRALPIRETDLKVTPDFSGVFDKQTMLSE